jgi:hypothetical protein
MKDTGMTKVITSTAMPDVFDARMRLIEDVRQLEKSASEVFGCRYGDMTPDKDHVGIHLIALGDSERYGFNRNGDAFPKIANQSYHHTFVKNGHVYRHHQNKDPNKKLGDVVKSAYCPYMGRVELFVHAHKEKCSDELQKIAIDGEAPFSMACRVQYDRCSICNGLRKSSSDPKQCDHVKYELGKLAEDGRITGTYNDEPNFFDISFVFRPADRIAWSLKTASDGALDSVSLAEQVGVWTPENLVLNSDTAVTKRGLATKLAEMEEFYYGLIDKDSKTRSELELWELRKAAAAPSASDEVIEALRQHDPKDVFTVLAQNQVVLDPVSFCKYAMGVDFGELAEYMDQIPEACNGVFGKLVKNGKISEICNDGSFDIDTNTVYSIGHSTELQKLAYEARKTGSFFEKEASHRAVMATIDGITADVEQPAKGSKKLKTKVANRVAEKYASYKLAAVYAIQSMHPKTDMDRQVALLAVQNCLSRLNQQEN